jgi:uncharacterized membrane protein YsdA (DUF1294 family)
MKTQYLPILVFVFLLVLSFYYGYTPLFVSVIFGVVSFITFIVYYKDKAAAVSGKWRTPESTLHILSLMCGWPGAIAGQQVLRHKTQKKSFRLIFWLTVLINVSVFFWLHTAEGTQVLRKNTYKIDNFLIYHSGSHAVINHMRQLTRFNADS